tara:strand:+ start:86 stop:355 length:270 start_codon:yes stop_codon:yes gene_type:complete
MKITKRQLKRLIREGIDVEYMREEILEYTDVAEPDDLWIMSDILGLPWEDDFELDVDAAAGAIQQAVGKIPSAELAKVHQEMTAEGLFG